MFLTARAVATGLVGMISPVVVMAQAGPSDPQVINSASTAKVSVTGKKLGGYLLATVRVGDDGRPREVVVIENTTEGFEQSLTKVLQSARFRPAIDAAGQPVEASIDMKVELRPSTGTEPKPVAAKPDPQLTEKEKARIKKMRCSDFVWEWDVIREEAGDGAATEFMPRIATTIYAALRTAAGEYVDAKVWKAAPKALKEAASQCKDNPSAPFFDGIFKTVMDEAVPK